MKPLELIERFLDELTAKAIPYCHWKSTTNIAASLSGETDLDLLVAPESREQCLALLNKLDFRQATDPWDLDLSGISHFFGYDHPSARIVHIHLHFQLLLGDDLLKNYRLPVENIFFSSVKIVNGIAIPAPEVEFITFVLRMTLKRRLLSILVRLPFLMCNLLFTVKQLVGLETPRLSAGAQAEFDDLMNKISEEKVVQTLCSGFPFVPPDLFRQCRNALANKADRFAWWTTGRKLTRTLGDYPRLTGFAAVGTMVWQAFRLRIRSVMVLTSRHCLTGKTPASGGRIIAFAGDNGDGVWKTNLVDDTAQWLRQYFSVATLHVVMTPVGIFGVTVSTLMKIWTLLPVKAEGEFSQALHCWLEAGSRYRAYRHALRLRKRGMMVLLDDIPLLKDCDIGPARSAGRAFGKGPVLRLMAAIENIWRRRINLEELMVLRLDSEIAPEGSSTGDEVSLGKGSGAVRQRQDQTAYAHLVATSVPLPEEISRIRAEVWDLLGRENVDF